MDLISAIKSGKPFKRKEWATWLRNGKIVENENFLLSVETLLANDFEIQEEKIELTAEQVGAAFFKAMSQIDQPTRVFLLKELGFKE